MNSLRNMPRKVLISLAVLLLSLVMLGGAFPLLGGASEDAETMGIRLKSEIDSTRKQITQALDDQKYVEEHVEEYESLMKSDRLVPHTRRAAVAELQKIATRNGITLDYTFQAAPPTSAAAAQSQPSNATYRVSVEQISLKVGAATDGAVYRFLEDLSDSFPGSAVTQTVRLARPPEISSGMLASLGQAGNPGIVSGEIAVIWRTAEAQEKKAETKK